MKNFNKQFIISNKDISDKFENVNRFIFNNIIVLSDKNLKYIHTRDKNNKSWLVLGVCITLHDKFKTVSDHIENSLTNEIIEISKFWDGRWVLIDENGIYGDAAHLLGIFYNINKNKDFYISSSLYALSQVLKIKQKIVPEIPNHIVHFIAPGTGFDEVEKLLVGTYFSFIEKKVKITESPIYFDFSNVNYQDIIDQLDKLLHIAFERMNELPYKQFLLALTSGKDSRLLLPYAIKHLKKEKFDSYYQEIYIGNKRCQRTAKKVAANSNLKWMFIKSAAFDKTKDKAFMEFSSFQNIDADRGIFARGQWNFGKDNALVIRGGGFHPDRNMYIVKGGGALDSNAPDFLEKMAYYLRVKEDYQYQSLKKWYKFYKSTEKRYAFVDYRDRLYTEQRQGAWMSAIEQSLDIQSKDSIHPANNKLILSYILALDMDKRKDRNHHIDLIKMNNIDQLVNPFNPKRSLINRIESSIKFRLIKYFNLRF